MQIIKEKISVEDLRKMAGKLFGNLVKVVVDIEQGMMAVDGELHADLEALMIEQGSIQANLWGINFYPDLAGDDFVEFDSMINLRPSQNNRSRGVENPETQKKILEIVNQLVIR